jgi:hypothetical protein
MLGNLVETVSQLVASGVLDAGNGNALKTKLNAALASVNHGNPKAACNQLGAFINQVEAMLKSGRLPAVNGQALLGAAEGVRAIIGCK